MQLTKICYSVSLIFILLTGCKNNSSSKSLKKNSKTLYEIETDSTGTFKDTLSIVYFEKNKKGMKTLKKTKIFTKNGTILQVEKFNDDEDLIYSEAKSNKTGILSTYKVLESNNNEEKAISIEYEKNKPKDTIYINYTHDYENGIKVKTVVTAQYKDGFGNKKILLFNKKENLISELFLLENDTISYTEYEYDGDILKKRILKNYKINSIEIDAYDEKGHINQKDIFFSESDSLIKFRSYKIETNQLGDIIKKVEINYPNETKRYIRYKRNSEIK